MSRNKGARGEREFISKLQCVVNKLFGFGTYELKRNLFQTREGGYDVTGLPEKFNLVAFEVKFQETLNLPNWWGQTLAQAGDSMIPVLAFRQSRRPWKIMMPVLLGCGNHVHNCEVAAVVDIDAFLEWYEWLLVSRM